MLFRSLGEDDSLVGNEFSIADIAITTAFVNFRLGGESVDASRWPSVAAYVDRVFSRPAIKPIVEGDLAAGEQLAGAARYPGRALWGG